MTIDAPLTASAGVDASRAPSLTSASAFAAVRLYTVSENPAFSRLAAIPEPIVPRPSIATLLLNGIVLLFVYSQSSGWTATIRFLPLASIRIGLRSARPNPS